MAWRILEMQGFRAFQAWRFRGQFRVQDFLGSLDLFNKFARFVVFLVF